jgi:hypothetical protein
MDNISNINTTNTTNTTNKIENIDSMLNSAKTINNMYKKIGYFDEYGGSVFLFILLTILLFVAHSYSVVMLNIKPIKENWAAERCKPRVIPFAGLINAPPGTSMNDYTNENFQHCLQNILISITGYAVQPITYTTALLNNVYSELAQGLDYMNNLMANIRANMAIMTQNTMSRIANILVPLQNILIVFKDFMGKAKGIFTASLYTSLGTYFALKSFLGAIGQLLIIILMILAGLIVGFWLVPFTWPTAITMTAIFVSVSIPLAIMLAFMSEVLHIQIDSPIPALPSKPNMCFDKNTILKMHDGKKKKISDIQPGDLLWNQNLVTAKLTLDAANVEMYQLHDVIVSANHCVYYHDLRIPVKNHPFSKKILSYKEPLIYCLNTSKKYIEVDYFVFSDWDELYEKELDALREKLPLDAVTKDKEWVHRYFDSGFSPKTILTTKHGEKIEIKDILIRHTLEKGETVIGIVEIYGWNLEVQKTYEFDNLVVEGGPNLQVLLGAEGFSTLDNSAMIEKGYFSEIIPKKGKLYHLLTNKKTFSIEGVQFRDYNSAVELFLT